MSKYNALSLCLSLNETKHRIAQVSQGTSKCHRACVLTVSWNIQNSFSENFSAVVSG